MFPILRSASVLEAEFLQTLSRSRPSFAFVCSPSLSFFPSLQSLPFPWRPCKEFQLEEFTPPPTSTYTHSSSFQWLERKEEGLINNAVMNNSNKKIEKS